MPTNNEEQRALETTEPIKEVSETMSYYPSARIVEDACFADYTRVQNVYDKLYDKISIILAFAGVALTIMFSSFKMTYFDFDFTLLNRELKVLIFIEILFHIIGILLMIISIAKLLFLMRGRDIDVLKSEDLRNKEIYREEEETALMWLVYIYTESIYKLRVIIKVKQNKIDRVVVAIAIGIVLYSVSIILQRGGV